MRWIWLASYPKSGNTWLRLLIANLGREEPADINAIPESAGIASSREWFDSSMLFASGLLTYDECDRLRPMVYEAKREEFEDCVDLDEGNEEGRDDVASRVGQVHFVKSHDAWTVNPDGRPLLGGSRVADAAILIVRDPRDVAPSLANHNGSTIDGAVDLMGQQDGAFCGQPRRQAIQLRQQLLSWSAFNASWLDQRDVPVQCVRYEDLYTDTAATLGKVLAFAGVEVSEEDVARAVRFAAFSELTAQEQAKGFREAPPSRGKRSFFRRGIAGGWADELTAEQVERIEQDHAPMMERLGYALSAAGATEERRAE